MSRNTLVLDVDNTIYPDSWGLMHLISDRMVQFLALKLQTRDQDIAKLIEEYRSRFNSIAIGVHNDFRSDFADFLLYSHEIDLSNFRVPTNVKRLLQQSGFQRKLIFSSAPMNHILNILDKFELTEEFDDIVSIEDVGYKYKPDTTAFESFYKATKSDPHDVVFIDDCPRNIGVAKAFGSYTVHIHAYSEPAVHSNEAHASLVDYLLSRSKIR